LSAVDADYATPDAAAYAADMPYTPPLLSLFFFLRCRQRFSLMAADAAITPLR